MNKTVSTSIRIAATAIVLALLLPGCKTRRVLEKSPLVPLSDNALLHLLDMNSFDFNSLNAKASASFKTESQNNSFKINLRMKADSIVWISITPALGIEAVRAAIMPDSLKFIDKLNNKYYVGPFDILDSLVNYFADFDQVQNLLVGNPIQISPDEKYVSSVEGLHYVLTAKVKRKVRKSVATRSDSTLTTFDVLKERKFEKAIEKFGDEDLILKRYFIKPGDFKVVRAQIDDIQFGRSIKVEYSNFEIVESQTVPMQINIQVNALNQSAKFDLTYSRIRLNEAQSYPFKVPAKYEPLR